MKSKILILLVGSGIVVLVLALIMGCNIQAENPQNLEFYNTVLGIKVKPKRILASCTTAPWYGALDSADFHAVTLPDKALAAPSEGFPKKMEYQMKHSVVGWHNGPNNEMDQKVFPEGIRRATRWLEQKGSCSPNELKMLLSIPSILERDDVYRAYVFRNDVGYVNRLALYIYDSSNAAFYVLRYGI